MNDYKIQTPVAIIIVVLSLVLLIFTVCQTALGLQHRRLLATQANLHDIQDAVKVFKEDIGSYPGNLHDLTVTKVQDLSFHAAPAKFRGPYLKYLPRNPYLHDEDESRQWLYDPKTGEVLSAAKQN